MVPRENKNNAYAKFWETNKEYYCIFQSGLLQFVFVLRVLVMFISIWEDDLRGDTSRPW